jgi:hypothetical protein|tara:strand:- start:552 stop:689 length:138 start_codon:yes stop_codon:yes gene_type:complete
MNTKRISDFIGKKLDQVVEVAMVLLLAVGIGIAAILYLIFGAKEK